MRGNAPSSDLEPGARRSGAVARPAGGVATHDSQPQPHYTTLLPNSKRPRPSPPHRIALKLGQNIEHGPYDDPQRIRAQRRPDPPQSHQNCLGQFQGSQGRRALQAQKTMPPTRLSVPKSPLPRRTTPNVARHVARPKSKYIEIGRQRPIG
ncbi:hypothetical protein BJV77DRAFT_1033451 [Russula vinacea]|nr:hypothetical protein BJV77DRAFT_1033451 [Russula vinacea]